MKYFCKNREQAPNFFKACSVVGLPGLEPGKAGPESAVLPLHHSPMVKCDAKVQLFFVKQTVLSFFCLKNSKKVLFRSLMYKKQHASGHFVIRKNYLCNLKPDWHGFCKTESTGTQPQQQKKNNHRGQKLSARQKNILYAEQKH